jgi:hypothetical protein
MRLSYDGGMGGGRAAIGLRVAGFPNLFTVTAGRGRRGTACQFDRQHVSGSPTACHMRAHGRKHIEPPTKRWTRGWLVNAAADGALLPRAKHSWYLGANVPGARRFFMPYAGGMKRYRRSAPMLPPGTIWLQIDATGLAFAPHAGTTPERPDPSRATRRLRGTRRGDDALSPVHLRCSPRAGALNPRPGRASPVGTAAALGSPRWSCSLRSPRRVPRAQPSHRISGGGIVEAGWECSRARRVPGEPHELGAPAGRLEWRGSVTGRRRAAPSRSGGDGRVARRGIARLTSHGETALLLRTRVDRPLYPHRLSDGSRRHAPRAHAGRPRRVSDGLARSQRRGRRRSGTVWCEMQRARQLDFGPSPAATRASCSRATPIGDSLRRLINRS